MEHGGKRTGAGRPQGSKTAHTLEAETLRQRVIQESRPKGQVLTFDILYPSSHTKEKAPPEGEAFSLVARDGTALELVSVF